MAEQNKPGIGSVIGTLLMLGIVGYWAYNEWIATPEKQRQRSVVANAEAAQRFKDWAYVAKEKEVRPGETVKLVVIPHPWGGEYMDTKCLVYTHAEFKQASMICPDARQDVIESGEGE